VDSTAVLSSLQEIKAQAQTNLSQKLLALSTKIATQQFPQASAELPTATSLGVRPPASCYRGEIGEQQIAIQAISKDVDRARAALDDARSSYNVALNACLRLKPADVKTTELTTKQNAISDVLGKIQAIAGIADMEAKKAIDANIAKQSTPYQTLTDTIAF